MCCKQNRPVLYSRAGYEGPVTKKDTNWMPTHSNKCFLSLEMFLHTGWYVTQLQFTYQVHILQVICEILIPLTDHLTNIASVRGSGPPAFCTLTLTWLFLLNLLGFRDIMMFSRLLLGLPEEWEKTHKLRTMDC